MFNDSYGELNGSIKGLGISFFLNKFNNFVNKQTDISCLINIPIKRHRSTAVLTRIHHLHFYQRLKFLFLYFYIISTLRFKQDDI